MNNQVVFNKFAVKSGDNWVADSDLLKRTAGYKVTAEDWNSIFLILASQADNNASAILGKQDKLTFDSTPTTDSTNLLTSGGVAEALTQIAEKFSDTKQDKLTFDSTPTANSSNPVTSGGVKDYVEHFAMDSAGFVIDAELSDTSEHALQNKKVKEAVDNLQAQITSNLTSIVENSRVVTNKFTEVYFALSSLDRAEENINQNISSLRSDVDSHTSAINSAASTAQNNLDSAKADLNQNISNLQNALNAEVTNRESAVTSLSNSVSENTDKINGILTTISGESSYSMIDGAIKLVKRGKIVLVSANFTKEHAMMFLTSDAAGDGVVVPDKYRPDHGYGAPSFPIMYNLAGNKIGYGTIRNSTGRIELFFESGANLNHINSIVFSVAYPSLY